MAELIGLPAPPPVGATALVPGTFDGVAVVVTGGGTGLGKAIAAEFARLGASIVVMSRKPEHLDAARDAIGSLGAPVLAVTCDIRDAESIAAAFDAAVEAFGLPAVLVNNAAANFPVPSEDMSPNAWRTVVDITLNGTFFCAREFGRRHLTAGTPGSIINVGASYAWTGGPGFSHSAAAKAGVKNMTESLAVEWGPYGIQVNGLVPGLFPHEDMTDDIKANLQRSDDKDVCQPALRVGQRQELGWAATFLASPYALHLRPHVGGRRRELAAARAHRTAGRHGSGADGQRTVRAPVTSGRDMVSDVLVLCTRNRPGEVRTCLDSVLLQTHVPSRVLVVDSSDDDATERIVAGFASSWPAGSVIEHRSAERGLTRQRSVGIDATDEEIVHFVDDDTVLEPGYIAIVDTFTGDTAGTLGGVGGFVTNQPPHRFRRVDAWLGLDSANGRRRAAVGAATCGSTTSPRTDRRRLVAGLRDVVPPLGVRDVERPNLAVEHAGEDVELSYRVRQRFGLVITPYARIEHNESPRGRLAREQVVRVELIARYERVRAGTGRLSRRAFWVSVVGQLVWYGAKGVVTLSGERIGIAKQTAAGIVAIVTKRV